MKDYYESYRMVDILLEMLNEQPNKQFLIKRLSNIYKKEKIIELAVSNGLIETDGEGKDKWIRLTESGSNHLNAGGFAELICIGKLETIQSNVSFKEHLDNSTNLLSIFGILNAVILFSAQKPEIVIKGFDFNREGMQFISISMYLLSILVLFELIWTTLKANINSWKIQVTYFLLCSTTVGMGMLFTWQYRSLLIGLLFFAGFLGLIMIITISIAKLTRRIYKRKELPKWTLQAIFIIVMLLASAFIQWILPYIKK